MLVHDWADLQAAATKAPELLRIAFLTGLHSRSALQLFCRDNTRSELTNGDHACAKEVPALHPCAQSSGRG